MKKILFFAGIALLAASCTEDYTDWADLQRNDAEEAKTVNVSMTAAQADINLGTLEGDSVQLFVPAVAVTDEATTTYQVVLSSTQAGAESFELTADEQGRVLKSELQDVVVALFGARPVVRTLTMSIAAYTLVNGQSIKNVLTSNSEFTVIPEAPEIEQAYYLTGSINGWDNTDTTYKLTNDGSDPYDNPTFTLRIPAPEDGANVEFKMTPESGIGGDWSKCLGGGDEGKFLYNNGGGNIVITAVPDAVYYDLVFNMLDQTWSATALVIDIEPAYYLTGSINGWDNTNTTYKLTNDGRDPYENPTFTLRIPATDDGSNIEFKMTPQSGLGGDWSKCLAAGATEGAFLYNNAGGNLVITAVEGAKYYDLTFNMMDLTWSYKAVNFNPFIYFIGATDGWANAEQKLALTDAEGIYTGFIYCADPNNWGNEFKFQLEAGNWDTELNTGTFSGGISGDFEGGAEAGSNIKATAGEGVYYITLNYAANTLTAEKVEKMGIIGDFNGWGGDAEMTWNATEYCYEATNPGVTAGGWKFRINADWAVNLGGETPTDLVANGSNLVAVGATIKLYPTRKTSDKIYCTVE